MARKHNPVTAEEIAAYMEKAYEIAQEGRYLHERLAATIRRSIEEFAEAGYLVNNLFQRDDGSWQANLLREASRDDDEAAMVWNKIAPSEPQDVRVTDAMVNAFYEEMPSPMEIDMRDRDAAAHCIRAVLAQNEQPHAAERDLIISALGYGARYCEKQRRGWAKEAARSDALPEARASEKAFDDKAHAMYCLRDKLRAADRSGT